jgi:choline dehydrogenase-like flavoprotein
VLVCAGAFETPKLLMLSGVGPAEQLKAHGIAVLQDSPSVGTNMAEHRGIALQYRLKDRLSHNPQFSGWRLILNGIRYYLTKTGVLSYGSHELMGFAKVLPQSRTADTQLFISPFSRVMGAPRPTFEKEPGAQCLIYPTRPTSRGTVTLRSADPADLPAIAPNALDTDYDRHVSVEMVHYVRKLFATPPLADLIEGETLPGAEVESDEQILQAIRAKGTWGFHTCGTARMGSDPASVIDPQLRVRGVEGLRVVDASVFPTLPSCNTTAPVAALAWRAAEIIRTT